ncbi:MAG TPA: hypothetical protein PLP05_11935, partial [Sedimentisphaerales bacterium]|nr:hypothetical protein [Sedimentisphaerales bacterium]
NINDKLNENTYPAMTENTWQYQRGYGRGDCLRSYELIKSPKILPNQTTTNMKGWSYKCLSPGQSNTYKVYIHANCRLVATLAWNRRVEWVDYNNNDILNSGELSGYLANLDLEIYEPSNTTSVFSENVNGLNPDDNVEKCDILVKKSGVYTIIIKNKSANGESASYGLAFEVLEPVKGDLEPIDYVVDIQDLQRMSQSWLVKDSDIDLAENGMIDFTDFSVLMNCWLNSDPKYYSN